MSTMRRIHQPTDLEVLLATHPQWAEAEIVAAPVKNGATPQVLVRRRIPDLISADGKTDLFWLPGEPVISLFTGAGGMDIGTEQAGLCAVVQHEFDRDACATLIRNRPNFFRHAALIQGDIRETSTSMLLREGGLRVGEAAAVCGGPPCQGFSTANSKSVKSTYDRRNDLMFEYLRVVRESQLRFFIMENVPGLLSFPGKRDGKTYVEAFFEAAYDCYYEMVDGLVDACDYGVPQHRTRFLCIGTRRDLVECDGLIGSLPAPATFSRRDLALIQTPGMISAEESRLIRQAPGVRYFPDRPFLRPPHPNHQNEGKSASHIEFYRRLLRDEPDRIVANSGIHERAA